MIFSNREKFGLIIVVLTLVSLCLLGEVISSSLVKNIEAEQKNLSNRRRDVVVMSKLSNDLPTVDTTKSNLLLIGNSHTYALPSLEKGFPLRPDPGATLIDELSADIINQNPKLNGKVNYYRLSYPNFLPYEILSRVGHLLYHGHRPKVVVFGLTWRNIARDTELRTEISQTYKDKAFTLAFKQQLKESSINAAPDILQSIENEESRAKFEEEKERTRSYADKLDEKITGRVGNKITLLGRSEELRARIYREFNYGVVGKLTSNPDNTPQYDVVESDLDFNLKCLQALVRLLRSNGASIVFYFAPERSDLPALIDSAQQERVMGDFKQFAESQGCVVLDARHVVPNEFWGWEHNTPDRSHFTEPGHKLLAQFIVTEAAKKNVWEGLLTP
jgi:hypothetical protein